ncbi:hypothetical protein LTR05_007300 [Lithohypha guttulata]|uniref:Distal membrane-arm assembly complex protein 1-like domain-containing protein n=1 Tax=Lithohypha guttulata TaxID=1690604 RepID=A0AAN7SUT4_9EURO|nr:hypothetical protein LTR05_007300 [Lithohypha guttulata]
MAIMDRIFASDRNSLEITSPYEEKEDCISCRVMGSTTFVALGGWTYYSGMKQLRERQQLIEKSKSKYKTGSRQLGIITLSATFVGLGIYRMLN